MADETQEGGLQAQTEMDARPTPPRVWRDQNYPTAKDFPGEVCVLGEGSDLEIAPGHPGWEWVARNCRFERGFRSHLRYGGEPTAPVSVEKSMPAPIPAPPAPAQAETHTVPAVAAPAPAAAPALPSLPDLSPAGLMGAVTGGQQAQPQTVATVGQPEPLASQSELAGVLAKGGDANMFTVLLGAVAVLGGGAAWKFYNKRTELKHEERMKELDNSKSQDDETRKQCQAASAMSAAKIMELEMKLNAEAQNVSALAARVEATEKKTSSFSADFDSDDLEEWRAKVDKFIKAQSKKPKT